MIILSKLSFLISNDGPIPHPRIFTRFNHGILLRTLAKSSSQTFNDLPLNVKIAWYLGSRAERRPPPAELPSTRNNSFGWSVLTDEHGIYESGFVQLFNPRVDDAI